MPDPGEDRGGRGQRVDERLDDGRLAERPGDRRDADDGDHGGDDPDGEQGRGDPDGGPDARVERAEHGHPQARADPGSDPFPEAAEQDGEAEDDDDGGGGLRDVAVDVARHLGGEDRPEGKAPPEPAEGEKLDRGAPEEAMRGRSRYGHENDEVNPVHAGPILAETTSPRSLPSLRGPRRGFCTLKT